MFFALYTESENLAKICCSKQKILPKYFNLHNFGGGGGIFSSQFSHNVIWIPFAEACTANDVQNMYFGNPEISNMMMVQNNLENKSIILERE
jgi:hypothetical protein